MAGRERSRVEWLHHKCTCSSTCFCKKGKQWLLEREGEGGLVALAWRWQEMEKVVQDACSYSKKMFVAPLPFHLSLIKPSLRRGQVKRCPGPWVEIGLTSWIVYTSIHTYGCIVYNIHIRWYAARCQCAQICIVSNIMTLCPPTCWSRLIHLFEYGFTKSGTKYTQRLLETNLSVFENTNMEQGEWITTVFDHISFFLAVPRQLYRWPCHEGPPTK